MRTQMKRWNIVGCSSVRRAMRVEDSAGLAAMPNRIQIPFCVVLLALMSVKR